MRSTWFLMAVLLLGTALRFYRVAEMPLRADEAANVFLAAQDLDAMTRVFIADDPHLPLFYWLLHFWMPLAGRSELAVRFPAIFAGVLIVALMYEFGKKLVPQRKHIALLGAGLVAINPYLIWDAQDAYMYSLLTAITLWSAIVFLRVMQSNAPLRVWVGYAVMNGLGLFIHYLAGLVMMAQGALWLWWSASRQIAHRQTWLWLVAQVATALFFLPWLVFVFPLLSNFKLDFFPPADLFEILARSLVAFSVGRADSRLMPPMIEPVIGGSLAVGFGILFLLGWLSLKRDQWGGSDARVVLFINLTVPLMAIWLFSIARFPIYDERYVLFLIPAFLLIVARGINCLQESRGGLVAALAGVYIALASAYSLNNYFYVPAFAKSPDWRSFTQQLMTQAQPGDALIQNYPDPALPYYLQERMPRILLPRANPATLAEVDADLNRLSDKYSRLWLQPAPSSTWDTAGLVSTWLERHARQVTTHEFRGVNLALYLPGSIALRQAQPVNVTFANRIRLSAFEVERAFKPGTTAQLVLYWTSGERSARDVTVFVHLYDRSGNLVSQQDHQPINGTYPFTLWNVGEMVIDSYVLTIPTDAPDGEYSLVVGLYDSQTQARWRVVDEHGQPLPDDRVMLASLEVHR